MLAGFGGRCVDYKSMHLLKAMREQLGHVAGGGSVDAVAAGEQSRYGDGGPSGTTARRRSGPGRLPGRSLDNPHVRAQGEYLDYL